MRTLKLQQRDNSTSERGQRAVIEILSAARDILINEGYPRLTMRNVAKQAGITVGNLSYYYSNKQDLLHDLLGAVIQGYAEEFERITASLDKSPEKRLEETIRFIMADLATRETTGFFPALWALAIHDEFAAKEMAVIYSIERAHIAAPIRELRPDLPERCVELLSLFVSASIEGQTMFVGHRREKEADLAAISNIAANSLINLVKTIRANDVERMVAAAE